MIDLGDLFGGDDYSAAIGVNDGGQVVGVSGTSTGEHAFLWDEIDGMQDLNDLLIDPTGWDLLEAWDINEWGQIVGTGDHDGVRHGFILDPVSVSGPDAVPEPGTLLLLGAGLLGLTRLRAAAARQASAQRKWAA